MPTIEIPPLALGDLTFFSMMLDLRIASLREAAFEGKSVSIEEIAEHYLDKNGLTEQEHAVGLAIMLATAVVRLLGLANVSPRSPGHSDRTGDGSWNLGGDGDS